jgi:ribosomal protein L31
LGSFAYTNSSATSKLNINLTYNSSTPVNVITLLSGYLNSSGSVSSGASVGIGNPNPHAPLQFANTSDQRKLVLYETANNDHQFIGFGNDADGLKYQIDSSTSSHRFYSGINASSSKELMRIKGDGKVGIGTNNPLNTLSVTGSDTGYIAYFKNTNTSTGGKGIKISLGKTHPLWTGTTYKAATLGGLETVFDGFDGVVSSFNDMILNHQSMDITKLQSLGVLMGDLAVGSLCNLTNLITEKINTGMNLPAVIPQLNFPGVHIWNKSVIFGGVSIVGLTIPELAIPALDIPATKIFDATTIVPVIPTANCSGFPTITVPTLNFSDVSNTLNNQNYFLQFTDKDDRQLGGVRAQSINNWKNDYLDLQYYMGLVAQFDAVSIGPTIMGYLKEFYALGKNYNAIGVEYLSAHGDYAEWLERQNPNEYISEGDIVGVKSGKITKDLNGAEQIMAVSHSPIVLGNMPEKSKQPFGNNIAFMGQIPVKVLGPVRGGDYIVANEHKGGYGKAVHPSDMNVDNYKMVVGRSWETNESDGPKMINTVVGVHNHGFLNIVQGLQQKIEYSESRLKQIEAVLNINQNMPLVSNKK